MSNKRPDDKFRFANIFYPARPARLLKKARSLVYKRVDTKRLIAHRFGPAVSLNATYVKWLKERSMLENAKLQAVKYSGKSLM